jgi:hypothetical protein
VIVSPGLVPSGILISWAQILDEKKTRKQANKGLGFS